MNFNCPYCKSFCTLTKPNRSLCAAQIQVDKKPNGCCAVHTVLIKCPNPKCNEISIIVSLTFGSEVESYSPETIQLSKPIVHFNQMIFPIIEQEIKQIPDYVPVGIKNDFIEASKIKNLSPKASATLSRRCLQGMIRDFWKIVKSRLIDEIKDLEGKVDPLTWQSIDSVRKIGNIGAHMEKDINTIIDVDENEAKLLLNLLENLIDDWYVARNEKEKRMKRLISIAENKTV